MDVNSSVSDLTRVFGGGELGRLIREHDWTATSLGPIQTWPPSLLTALGIVLQSAIPMVLLWGDDGVMLYNDAYSVFAGGRHPKLLGTRVREGWPEVAAFNDNVMKVGLAGGSLAYRDQELTLFRHGRPEQVWMNLDYSPVYGESGRPAGVIAIVFETTEQVLARAALRASEARQAFRVALSDALRRADDPAEVIRLGIEMLGSHLQATMTGYGAVAPAADRLHLMQCWAVGDCPQIDGCDLGHVAPFRAADLRAGRTVRVEDRSPLPEGAAFADMAACVSVPQREAGRLSAVLFVLHAEPRAWTDAECHLIEEVAERIAAASQRARIEAELRRSEARARGIVDKLQSGLIIGEVVRDAAGHAVDWRYLDVNPAWEELMGMSRHDVLGRTVREIIPSIEDAWIDDFARVTQTGEAIRFVREVASRRRWYEGQAFRLEPGQFAVSFVEVTERRRAEAELRELNATLERRVAERTAERDRVWRNSRDLLVIISPDGVFRAVNPAWAAILGHDPAEVVGRSFADFLWPEDASRGQGGPDHDSRRGGLTDFENRYRHRDGTPRWISWHTAAEGDLVFAYGRDVTAQRQQEAALRQTEEQLRQSQKMEAVGQLTGGLAHDFNNLLTGIMGSLELLQSRVAQGRFTELDRYLATAQGAAARAAALTHRLLAFSRRQTLDPKSVQVNRLVASMEELIRRTMGPQITVETVLAGGLWPTLCDPNQLENALLNLCINARDAMPDGGRLTIETANTWFDERGAREHEIAPGQYVGISVTDTGTGMTPAVAARAFDPFFTTKPIGLGTGLGLSMIYGFAQQSGGQVRIYTEVGIGTTMRLYLPRHLNEAKDERPPDDPPLATRPSRGGTVLVVDDEPTVRMLVASVLGELDFTVVEAADAASGLKTLRSSERIDLLITDVGLPGGMNGRQMADAARQIRPGLRVLFITGYAENAVLGNGTLESGMQVMIKPFSMKALAARIKAVTAES